MLAAARLSAIELFEDLARPALRELAARGRRVSFEPDQVLWRSGGESRGLHVILSGRVRVTASGTGRPHRVHVEGPGGTLGEIPLFGGGPYPATAVAATCVECAAFPTGALRAAIAADPELAFRLLARLAGRARVLIDRLDALVGLDVRQRLAAHLLAHRTVDERLVLPGTQETLAEELGTVREVVVRALRELEEAGAIRRERGSVHVVDVGRLEALAG